MYCYCYVYVMQNTIYIIYLIIFRQPVCVSTAYDRITQSVTFYLKIKSQETFRKLEIILWRSPHMFHIYSRLLGQVIVSHECALSANFADITFPTFDTANPREIPRVHVDVYTRRRT